ncbi:alpha-ketoglutarate-dependent dioxygenase AlkB family protein [Pseudarthrobacter sp. J1738]|uniref:alpha-ketoglutarate-dependent dioxygenase AlkB family protein n=1 Tax=unclassified Pseudarthrobacter TaxID=2647000 RepID=UPI003D2BC437
MSNLFSDADLIRPPRELRPGAVWVPGWLNLEQQSWLVARFSEWTQGPVPARSPLVGGHPMSVKSVHLGWYWRPYQYSREAVDGNGNKVLDVPDWMVRLGQQAIAEAQRHSPTLSSLPASAVDYRPDAILGNYYDEQAHMGMHQDAEERSLAPVVSLSIGDSCRFRFGNSQNRNKPYEDISLASGDMFVFGGPARLAFHGVQKIIPASAPEGCGINRGRINITMRVTGLTDATSGQ